jgi:hypothetical protein
MTAYEALQEALRFLDITATNLERIRDRQLRIDPDWTTVELDPGVVEIIADGLRTAAGNIRAVTTTLPPETVSEEPRRPELA